MIVSPSTQKRQGIPTPLRCPGNTVSSKHHQEALASTFAHFNSSDTGLATADAAALRDVMALGANDEALLSVGVSATPQAF